MKANQEALLKYWMSPGMIKLSHRILSLFIHRQLEYAPDGWDTKLHMDDNSGWNSKELITMMTDKWNDIVRITGTPGPLGFSYEHSDMSEVRNLSFHNMHMSYAYVLALAAHQKSAISVLDWGGGVGHYYLISKAVLPDVTIDFHCKEVPKMVEIGRRINPSIHWYTDESCLERKFDVVMINGSLQYTRDWSNLLKHITNAVDNYLFLARAPVVEHVPGFVAIQRIYGSMMRHHIFNMHELLGIVNGIGLNLIREFIVGDLPFIKGAPEQCELRSWLFKRMKV